MDATSFVFTMTMPGDARLVAAVRDLAVHAAKYAQLAESASAVLEEEVSRAATATVAASEGQGPVEVRFEAGGQRLEVMIACDVAAGLVPPGSKSSAGLTVAWSRDGSRHVCVIAQRFSA